MGAHKKLPGLRASVLSVCLLTLCLPLISPVVSSAGSHPVEGALKSYLKDNFPWAEIVMSDLTFSAEPPGSLPERIIMERGPLGRAVFSLEFKGGREIKASANVKAFDWVVMSRRALRKGYSLHEGDVYLTMMEVVRIPKGAIRETGKVIGRQLTRSVIANMPLVDNMIAETPAVKRGQRVILMVESPSFNITTVGETKENGRVGAYVKVVNLASKKVITGLLVNENTVRVEF